jgi:type I restriction enzyme R subunit
MISVFMATLNESTVEDAALAWFEELGYSISHGPHLAPGEPKAERDSFGDVVLVGRLREAIRRLNPTIPDEAREEALRKVLRTETTSLIGNNRNFHHWLRDGVEVEYRRADGSIAGDRVRLVDFENPGANDWLAVNQFTVIEGQHNRRPDIVVFRQRPAAGIDRIEERGGRGRDDLVGLRTGADLQGGDSVACCTTTKCWW